MVTAAFTKMLGLPERRDYLRTHSTPPLLGGPAGLQRCTPQLKKKKLFCNSNKHPYVATALKTELKPRVEITSQPLAEAESPR